MSPHFARVSDWEGWFCYQLNQQTTIDKSTEQLSWSVQCQSVADPSWDNDVLLFCTVLYCIDGADDSTMLWADRKSTVLVAGPDPLALLSVRHQTHRVAFIQMSSRSSSRSSCRSMTSWCPLSTIVFWGRSSRWEHRDMAEPAHSSSATSWWCQRLSWMPGSLYSLRGRSCQWPRSCAGI